MDRFLFRLVQWGQSPPQINMVCKRCLMVRSANTVFDMMNVLQQHSVAECHTAIVADFTGVPEKLTK